MNGLLSHPLITPLGGVWGLVMVSVLGLHNCLRLHSPTQTCMVMPLTRRQVNRFFEPDSSLSVSSLALFTVVQRPPPLLWVGAISKAGLFVIRV